MAVLKPDNRALASLSLAALGIVFGDLGTSPLYALRDTFVGTHPIAVTPDNVFGVISLFLWALIIVVCIKYLAVIMRADNEGEGGILALLALTGATDATEVGGTKSAHRMAYSGLLVGLGIAGAALLYGDGIITPAISVLSAVEGLEVVTTSLSIWVVPITVVVLIGLFLVQPQGSGRIGALFGPVLAIWFIAIALLGGWAIAQHPAILAALDPRRGVHFFVEHGWSGFPVLGAVVLCLTGGEALYADMGHFGRRPIRIAWFGLAFPALVLSYLGQGATLLTRPQAIDNPFFHTAPTPLLLPLVILATASTVIASQALISAVFSLTRQAMQLGLTPRLKVLHTSAHEMGQIYLPALNWGLMGACLALVVGFQSSSRLAAAFGLAVSGTMAITTLLFAAVARWRWGWSRWKVLTIAGSFFVIDAAFIGANALKLLDGGWIPLVIGAVVFVMLSTWRRGRQLLEAKGTVAGDDADDISGVLASLASGSCAHVQGTAVYLHRHTSGVPRSLLHNIKHNHVVHRRVIFLTILTEAVPTVSNERRVLVTTLAEGFWRVVARYGFMEDPDIPALLKMAVAQGLDFKPAETTYFLGRETVISSDKPGMARWRERLFGVMLRNARPASMYFELPPNRVVELGTQVEI